VRALVVEDDAASRRTIGTLLKAMGFDVTSVRSVAEARWVLAMSLPAVIVFNRSLPDGSGIEILRLIRQSGWDVSTAVICTPDDPMLGETIGLRPDTLFEKPVDLGALRSWLTGVLERRAAPRSTEGQ
jgi:DNA-binding response OmpR family regulator